VENIKFLYLTRNKYAVVDIDDFCVLKDNVWFLANTGYAEKATCKEPPTLLHRILMGDPAGLLVDHKNGNKLDNRRVNLRVVTKAENNSNADSFKDRDNFRGVSFNKSTKKWQAVIRIDGELKLLGKWFPTDVVAHAAFVEEHLKRSVSFYRDDKPDQPRSPTEQEMAEAVALRENTKKIRTKKQAVIFGKKITNNKGEIFDSIRAACRQYRIPKATMNQWLTTQPKRPRKDGGLGWRFTDIA